LEHIAGLQYHATYDRDFPTLEFTRKPVALRREDRNWRRCHEN
jgi:hypothetical protein